MHRQSVIYIVIAIVAALLIVGLFMTRSTAHLKTVPGIATPGQSTGSVGSTNTVEPCTPTGPASAGSTTNTATTTTGTTPDGRPTGAFVGQPCTTGTSGTQETTTHDVQPGR